MADENKVEVQVVHLQNPHMTPRFGTLTRVGDRIVKSATFDTEDDAELWRHLEERRMAMVSFDEV